MALPLLIPVARGQTVFTWAPSTTGGSSNLNTANDWSGGTAPTNNGTDILAFSGNTRKTTPTLNANWSVYGLEYLSTSTVTDKVSNSGTNTYTMTIGVGGITQSYTSLETLAVPVVLGASQTWAGGTAGLTVTGATTMAGYTLTTSGAVTIGTVSGAGTVTVGSGSTLTLSAAFTDTSLNVNLNGGTLVLSTGTDSLAGLTVTGASVIDFVSGKATTLDLTGLNLQSGATLTVNNWVNGTDYFYTTSWTGGSHNAPGTAPSDQITFTGYSASLTQWYGNDQVSPVPEPSSYSLWMSSFALALAGGRLALRRRSSRDDTA